MAQTTKKHKARPHIPKAPAPKSPSKGGALHTAHPHRTKTHAVGAGPKGHGGKLAAIGKKGMGGAHMGKAPKAGAKLKAGAQPKGGIPAIAAFGAGKKKQQQQAFE